MKVIESDSTPLYLKRRLQEHAKGEVTTTRYRRPLRLIKYEYFTNIKDAKTREVFLKSGFGRKELKKCLQDALQELGGSRTLRPRLVEACRSSCRPIRKCFLDCNYSSSSSEISSEGRSIKARYFSVVESLLCPAIFETRTREAPFLRWWATKVWRRSLTLALGISAILK